MNKSTYEHKKDTQNGVRRFIFAIIAITLQVVFIIMMIMRINTYLEGINYILHIATLVLVLVIYGKHTTSSMKMPWIILILSFPVVGISLYLLIGMNGSTYRMRRRYHQIDDILFPLLPDNTDILEKLQKEDPESYAVSSYIDRNALYPIYQNTDVTYYDMADKGLDAQIEDMKKAKSYIFMEYHAIEDKSVWHRIQNVLVEKVHEGVEVRVFYDDMGSIGFINNTDFVRRMEKLGIHCRVFNPFAPFVNVFLNNRDHRKITVIDGRIGYTGGYNLAEEYMNITHPYGLWKDTGIRLEGDAVKSLLITFLEMWNAVKETDRDDTSFDHYLDVPTYTAKETGGYVHPYADSPLDDEHVGEDVYITIANKAERYCYFITPYLIITDEMSHALSLAAKRGVDVRIITPGIPDKKVVYGVTRSFYNGLVRNGVRIFEWTPGFCHAKMSVSDDVRATCGTINLDYRSLYHHFENGCYMVNCDAVHKIKDDFDSLFPQCREVTEQYRSGRSQFMRLWQLFMRLFAELM